jgi:hypothetical protein
MRKIKFNRRNFIQLLILFFILLGAAVPAIAAGFRVPEKFTYDIGWGGIKAGTATIEIKDSGENIKIITTATSSKLLSVFYEVEDKIESTLVKNPSFAFIGQPSNYRVKIREGRHKRDKEFIFKNDVKRVAYIDYLQNEKEEFDIPGFVFDALSSFYYVRTLNLEVNKPVYVTVFDNKKIWNVEVQVLRKEKVSTTTGEMNTIVIKPLMQSEGIFFKKGDINIWLTDDEKKIPIMLSVKLAFGSVTAILVGGFY